MVSEVLGMLPELTVVAGAMTIMVAWANSRDTKPAAMIGFLTLLLAAFFTLGTLADIPGLGFMPQGGTILGLYSLSAFAGVLKIVFLAGTAIVVLASPEYMQRSTMQAEYYGMLLMAALGMMIVASSQDMLTLFLGIEVAAFASYVLAGSFKTEPTSNEASMKYFITGALSSAITLFGISLLYGASAFTISSQAVLQTLAQSSPDALAACAPGAYDAAGNLAQAPVSVPGSIRFDCLSLSMGQLAATGGLELFASVPMLAIGVLMVLGGLGFKLTVAPFHMWAPDAYTGAPDTVAAFLGGVGKGLGVVAMLKVFLWALAPLESGWAPFVAGLAILTMTWGNLVAIRQDDIKRMLAYSSIAQAGYILIVLPVGTEYAIAGGVFHTLTNLLMKGGAFLIVAAFAMAGIGSKLQDYEGLGRRNPWLAAGLTIFLLSLAGLPPLGGFWSKFVLFSSAVESGIGGSWLWWLAVAGIINSAISLYYYARWIRTMYVEPEMHPIQVDVPAGLATAIAISVIGIIAVGLWVNPVVDWSLQAANALLAAVPG